MKNKGNALIESLLFFTIVLFIVNYVVMLMFALEQIQNINLNQDEIYEEAYQ